MNGIKLKEIVFILFIENDNVNKLAHLGMVQGTPKGKCCQTTMLQLQLLIKAKSNFKLD